MKGLKLSLMFSSVLAGEEEVEGDDDVGGWFLHSPRVAISPDLRGQPPQSELPQPFFCAFSF